MEFKDKKVYTLTQLALSIKSVLEKNYTSSYWVKAEIAKLNHYPRSGHAYPELVEKLEKKILAQFRATIWAEDYKSINKKFIDVTGEQLKEGIEILFYTRINFHAVYGLSLSIIDIEPSFTLGKMALEKTQTIELLKKEGVFDSNKKQLLPVLPRKIAIISVETSKGFRDYLEILKGFAGKYDIYNMLFPAILQGDQAVKTILQQLAKIRQYAHIFDAVAIIRGGGGDIGLNCYNEYEMAKEVATFPIPVITGIGHSTNETVVEMVSHINKITPTDVAYFFLGHFESFSQRIDNAKQKVITYSEKVLLYENQRLSHIAGALSVGVKNIGENQRHNISALCNAVKSYAMSMIKSNKSVLYGYTGKLTQIHFRNLLNQRTKIENLHISLRHNTDNNLDNNKNKLLMYENKINMLDPSNVLKRGYSISMLNGEVIKSAKSLVAGQKITTRLYDGSFESEITNTKKS